MNIYFDRSALNALEASECSAGSSAARKCLKQATVSAPTLGGFALANHIMPAGAFPHTKYLSIPPSLKQLAVQSS